MSYKLTNKVLGAIMALSASGLFFTATLVG